MYQSKFEKMLMLKDERDKKLYGLWLVAIANVVGEDREFIQEIFQSSSFNRCRANSRLSRAITKLGRSLKVSL